MLLRIACATLLTGLAFAVSAHQAEPTHADPRALVNGARTSLVDAIAAAEKAASGRAVEAELESIGAGADRRTVYDIDVLNDRGALFEVVVSAQTGAVESVREERDDDEAAAFRGVLAQTDRSLVDWISLATGIVRGTAISAEFDAEDGPECDVLILIGDYLVEVGFDVLTGRIIELEIESDLHEDDDDDEEDDDDEDEDENHD